LGPLGPVGAHGYARADGGDYVDDHGDIVRAISMKYSPSAKRVYSLFEMYDEDRAKELGANQGKKF
jgi:hypothetical protein